MSTFHIQTEYSLLNSSLKLEELFSKAKENNYDFLTMADNQNLYGMYRFYQLSKKYDIKPIIGLKVYFHYNLSETNLLVYAKNDKGIKNLIKLSTLLQTSTEEITLEKIKDYDEGLFFITPGLNSFFENSLLKQERKNAYTYLEELKSSFKEVYVGLSLQSNELTSIAKEIVEIAEELKTKILITNQSNYLEKEDKVAYDALRQIDNNQNEIDSMDLSFLTKEELIEKYKDYPYVFDNGDALAQKIEYQAPFNQQVLLPKFKTKNNVSSSEYLEALAKVGLKKRLEGTDKNSSIYQERLMHELKVINDMGYADYFLIVYDFVKYAKTNDILVGPGRGSAAGSLVSYCLGITDIDPIFYDLLFERFLNPERKTMPDIDLDFPDNKRDQVIAYVKEKYGKDHIAYIITFGTFALRSSIRDIARVMKIDVSRVNGIIKRVLDDRIDYSDSETVRLLTVAKRIEGLKRHTGTHAAGIILSNDKLTDIIPLQKGMHEMYQTQFEATDLEKLGLLKIDFLGIRNLAIIDEVMKLANLNFKIQDITLDDEKTYELLSSAKTTGIFQLESTGMRQVLRKLKPSNFEDIVSILALYRPGPMDHIDEFIERRHGKTYQQIDTSIQEILDKTYGIIIYQEQIMQIASKFANYTLAEADLLRRGISKKDLSILENERKRFVEKAILNHQNEKTAQTIYDYIVRFANYGFNRSHSVSYAMVAYQMAYLKANYFKTFMTVLLTSVINNPKQTLDYIGEAKQQGIRMMKPNILYSTFEYKETKEGILLPLTMIKGLGNQIVKKIIEKRNQENFKNYDDFKIKTKDIINEKILSVLIFSGALDCFNLSKRTLYENRNLDVVLYGQYLTDYKPKIYDEYDLGTLIEQEFNAYGFNLFYSPLILFGSFKEKENIKDIEEQMHKDSITFVGNVVHIKKIKTKKNQEMAFIKTSDGKLEVELTVFPNEYERYIKTMKPTYYIIQARKDKNTYILTSMKEILGV
ncbi:DNA polymerase III alpha subunit [Alteracholeplasma palmae J233]|uniref:DNA-directed DNA polymerase n=1 Tax=Alteracholeplasma palmae (strain ATCC 49389 / J233) TaxID=1318466 RepID=U4KS66_ALTPJ|nr:DNA polymerase III subunit alpha [Alteracholeplasma palmae]CCV64766.1 DNA polymerase III alpha subunit [Alteracholeplasma palmae J233]